MYKKKLFEHWSKNSAYWFGYLFANSKTHRCGNNSSLKIDLPRTKNPLAKRLYYVLNQSYGIRHSSTPETLSVDQITYDLHGLGINSDTVWPINLPTFLESHFVRGYFDCKGGIYFLNKNFCFSVWFSGNQYFVEYLRNRINYHTDCSISVGSIMEYKNHNKLHFGGCIKPKTILNWMYNNSTKDIRLETKYKSHKIFVEFSALSTKERLTKYQKLVNNPNTGKTKSCNDRYFKEWSADMAYWSGFLFADGCIEKNLQGIFLGIKCTDTSHIENFQKALESTYVINFQKQKLSQFCQCYHSVHSANMAKDLAKYGCVPCKSLILRWPQALPAEFENHFARGYFDGDGCISFIKTNKSFSVSFSGTQSFLYSLRECINKNIKNASNHGSFYQQSSIYRLDYGGNKSSMNIVAWLYENSNVNNRLDRKFSMFNQFQRISAFSGNEKLKSMEEYKKSDEWINFNTCFNPYCPRKDKIIVKL